MNTITKLLTIIHILDDDIIIDVDDIEITFDE
jgi:hypothetical protein